MDDRDRIDRLEVQLARLEWEVRNLKQATGLAGAPDRTGSRAGAAAGVRTTTRSSRFTSWRARAGRDLEAWFGENALLVVGVLALVAAVGFALKYAFEQGWISPALRVLAGLAIGLAVAGYGERLRRRGLRRFGAAALGAGAAIAYLAVWAAAGPYAFVPAGVGIAALAVLSGLVLVSAWRGDEPYLATIAAAGAYLAPFLLGDASASANLLLGYTALVSAGVATIAIVRGWQLTLGIVLVGFFVGAAATAGRANEAFLALYLAGGGAAAVKATRVLGWRAYEVAAWAAAWVGLFLGAVAVDGWAGWAYVAAPALLVAQGWFEAGGGRASGVHERQGTAAARTHQGVNRSAMLAASALLWAVVAVKALPPAADAYPLIVIGVIGLLYVAPALAGRIPDLLVAGVGVLALGVLAQWNMTGVTLGWAVLVVIAGIATRRGPLSTVRWTAVALGALAVFRFLTVDVYTRPETDLAFVGSWPLALYGVIVALVLLAGPQWREIDRRFTVYEGIDLRIVTWLLAGVLVFLGGTTEIRLAFAQRVGQGSELAGLAGGLAVSAFWLLYAGVLLAYGFRTDRRAVRVAGLVVAALAILKVVFYDLANLEALYRVASFALLALITLLGAYAYHRRAGQGRPTR